MPELNSQRVVIAGANGYVAKNVRSYLHKKGINLISISRKNFQNFSSEKKLFRQHMIKIPCILKLKIVIH